MSAVKHLSGLWRKAGVEPGDIILIHSSTKRLLQELASDGHSVSQHDILESLLDAVGSSGTLMLPLFNFSFTRGVPFDIRTTPSEMGGLTECGRMHPDAVRTGHPIYSFAVIGRLAPRFAEVNNNSGYAEDSPFGMLRREGGKIGVIDLPDQHSMTFYHHVEEVKQVPYRYFKSFSGSYTDASGNRAERSYRLYVRDLENGVVTHVHQAGELAWKRGIYKGDRPGQGAGFRTVRAQDIFDMTAWLIETGQAEGNLFIREEK